jgi:hypothetical protein
MSATPAGTGKRFFNVSEYVFTERVQSTTPGAITKKDKNENTFYELHFRDVSGLLASVTEKDDQYGKKFNFEIIDGEETIIVQLWKESSYADTFISKLPNIDLSQPIKLIPYSFTPENGTGGKKQGITVMQNGIKINTAFPVGENKGQPQAQEFIDRGIMSKTPTADEWKLFFTEMRKFYSMVAGLTNEKLTSKPATYFSGNNTDDQRGQSNNVMATDPDDDLPF